MKRIAVIPGDGIGVDVTIEAVRVLEEVARWGGEKIELKHYDWGAEKYLSTGISLPPGGIEEIPVGPWRPFWSSDSCSAGVWRSMAASIGRRAIRC